MIVCFLTENALRSKYYLFLDYQTEYEQVETDFFLIMLGDGCSYISNITNQAQCEAAAAGMLKIVSRCA